MAYLFLLHNFYIMACQVLSMFFILRGNISIKVKIEITGSSIRAAFWHMGSMEPFFEFQKN
jgi:hypothetical protein